MDHFGIGSAIEGGAHIYFRSARQTGRTTQLIKSLRNGDRVVVEKHEHAHWLMRRAKELGKDINVIACPVNDPQKLFERPPSIGRTIFEHDWVEQYYLQAIKTAQSQIDYFERESGGHGYTHEKTKMQASAIEKWKLR